MGGAAKKKRADGPVRVPAEVLRGLEAVRLSGGGGGHAAMMLDRMAVQVRAMEMGHSEAARWVSEHPGPYADGVLRGFAPA